MGNNLIDLWKLKSCRECSLRTWDTYKCKGWKEIPKIQEGIYLHRIPYHKSKNMIYFHQVPNDQMGHPFWTTNIWSNQKIPGVPRQLWPQKYVLRTPIKQWTCLQARSKLKTSLLLAEEEPVCQKGRGVVPPDGSWLNATLIANGTTISFYLEHKGSVKFVASNLPLPKYISCHFVLHITQKWKWGVVL